MTEFQTTEGQRIAAYLESCGLSQYRVGGMAVLFPYHGKTHCVSSVTEARILFYNIHHGAAMDTLRAERAA